MIHEIGHIVVRADGVHNQGKANLPSTYGESLMPISLFFLGTARVLGTFGHLKIFPKDQLPLLMVESIKVHQPMPFGTALDAQVLYL